ncbi:hypothetical protein C8Q80DRAFT_1172300 [Daedaleopsis nitida]|nr:hypothetical protein C8Q80DRAFT_1172300 [Daedaleopsis nitida]
MSDTSPSYVYPQQTPRTNPATAYQRAVVSINMTLVNPPPAVMHAGRSAWRAIQMIAIDASVGAGHFTYVSIYPPWTSDPSLRRQERAPERCERRDVASDARPSARITTPGHGRGGPSSASLLISCSC